MPERSWPLALGETEGWAQVADGAPQPYTANLMKVGAMLPETLTLLRAWEGEPRPAFTRRMLEQNLVGKTTRVRLADLLARVFWRRFPLGATPGLADASAFVRADDAGEASRWICLLHAALAEPLLADVLEALSGRVTRAESDAAPRLRAAARAGTLGTEDVVALIRERADPTATEWSLNTIRRTARGALAALRDFGLLAGRGRKRLVPLATPPLAAFLYAAHAWHSDIESAHDLALSPRWSTFLLDPAGVELRFLQAHAAGHLRYYRLGDTWRIDWIHGDLGGFVAAYGAAGRGPAREEIESPQPAVALESSAGPASPPLGQAQGTAAPIALKEEPHGDG